MSFWFWLSIAGEIVVFPIYFLSLEHGKLQQKFGKEKGIIIGDILGMISGWGYFLFLFGIWLSPQPRFILPFLEETIITIPMFETTIPLIHFVIFLPIIIIVLWLSLLGVKEVTLKVSETHRPEKIVTTGVYSLIRHPQYFGALLAHISISILLSAWYSFVLTPIMILYLYLLAWKEEKELIKEFGSEYKEYQSQIPMLIPKLRFKQN
ncbi:MAG: methyltransferase family protein [Candidatus Hodarchaeales archaeon]|jgi:protein-S-isoprenylcysteine O-methyltransferase Ste14